MAGRVEVTAVEFFVDVGPDTLQRMVPVVAQANPSACQSEPTDGLTIVTGLDAVPRPFGDTVRHGARVPLPAGTETKRWPFQDPAIGGTGQWGDGVVRLAKEIDPTAFTALHSGAAMW